MIRTALIGTGFLLLSACAPFETYYKTGASVSRLQTDTTNCQVRGVRDAPVTNQIKQAPPHYIPGRTHCDGNGHCRSRGGYWRPGRIYTIDTNAPLRQKVVDQCMAAKGYQRTEIPICSQSMARAVPPAATRTLPQLTPNSCVIRNESGSWQIVSVGDTQSTVTPNQ